MFIPGIGFGLMYLPSVILVGFYFEKKRALATGIALCGSGIGTFVFAPFSRFLITFYGWKGGLLIISGICLNGCVCAALFRPISQRNLKYITRQKLARKVVKEQPANKKARKQIKDSASHVTPISYTTFDETGVVKDDDFNREVNININTDNREVDKHPWSNTTIDVYSEKRDGCSTHDVTNVNKPARESEPGISTTCSLVTSFLRQMFDITLLKRVSFTIVMLSNFLTLLGRLKLAPDIL